MNSNTEISLVIVEGVEDLLLEARHIYIYLILISVVSSYFITKPALAAGLNILFSLASNFFEHSRRPRRKS